MGEKQNPRIKQLAREQREVLPHLPGALRQEGVGPLEELEESQKGCSSTIDFPLIGRGAV